MLHPGAIVSRPVRGQLEQIHDIQIVLVLGAVQVSDTPRECIIDERLASGSQ